MKLPIHGGDVYAYPTPPLDFSANISPLGLPETVRRTLRESVDSFDRYPDAHCRALRDALAVRERIDPAWILCGNGAADLIYRVAFALQPDRALIPMPAFAEYERALTAAGCACMRFPLTAAEQFRVTEALCEALTPDISLLVLTNPNNPTGQPIERKLLLDLLDRCKETGTRLLLDECFLPFLPDWRASGLADRLAESPQLLILRAFTKFYAMAGLRLGYLLCADRPLLEKIAEHGPPWSVSTPAQTAGLAALRDSDYPARVREAVQAGRVQLIEGLSRLGMRVSGSQANFIFFYSARTDLYERLLQSGVLIRSCANFPGLNAHYYRVAVRTAKENAVLLARLTALLKEAD